MRTRSQSRKLADLPTSSGPSAGSGARLADQLRLCCGESESGRPRIDRLRQWIALSHCASPSRRSLINTRTEVDRPELSTHVPVYHCFGFVDGLLVLCDKAATSAVRLLNPLTGALVHFLAAITDVRDTKRTPAAAFKSIFNSSEPLTEEEMRAVVIDAPKIDVPDPSAINGAAIIDDSTSTTPPTLVLAVRHRVHRMICAKPGDQCWVSVHFGEQREPLYNANGQIKFHSLLSFRGHCCVTTFHGDVMQVDVIPLNGIGKYATFVGQTYSVMLPTDKFPKHAPNAVYLNYFHQKWCHLGIYYFNDRRISPPREFTQGGYGRLSHCACRRELADYLVVGGYSSSLLRLWMNQKSQSEL